MGLCIGCCCSDSTIYSVCCIEATAPNTHVRKLWTAMRTNTLVVLSIGPNAHWLELLATTLLPSHLVLVIGFTQEDDWLRLQEKVLWGMIYSTHLTLNPADVRHCTLYQGTLFILKSYFTPQNDMLKHLLMLNRASHSVLLGSIYYFWVKTHHI